MVREPSRMIRLTKPDISFEEVADDVRAILESGILTRGPYLQTFEEAVASYVGTRYSFATTSATTALHLSLVASGIGPGDEVLVSDFTFPASGNVIVQAGAKPVLVDCLAGRFDIDAEDAARKITKHTRAIMPVDPFGQPAELAGIRKLAEANGLMVIEDAACAMGAERDGRRCGAWPGVGCFSFHPRKVPTTGEGGMITTDDEKLAERITLLRNHGGRAGELGFEFVEQGFNYRLSEVQAALGLAQMKRIDAIIADRRRSAQLYQERLKAIPGAAVPLSAAAEHCTFQSFVVLLDDAIDRCAVIKHFVAAGIESTIGTYAMHAQPAFARFGYKPGDLPNSWRAQCQSLTLPLLPRMDPAVVDHVVGMLESAVREARR